MEPLPIGEHVEFSKRVDDHLSRIDARLAKLESDADGYTQLALNIERLSASTEAMVAELRDQSERLKELEDRDGERWRGMVSAAVTAIVSAVVGYALAITGMIGG